MLTIAGSHGDTNVDGIPAKIKVAWATKAKDPPGAVESDGAPESLHNEALIQSIVRAQAWMHSLREGTYESIENLADANRMHPKVVRQALRMAFLSPEVASAILEGRQPQSLSVAQIPKLLPLRWADHQCLLACSSALAGVVANRLIHRHSR
jgi:site-specific DNA recombinase